MPIQVSRPKWILYKHTSKYELVKAVALDVKNMCASNIGPKERVRMEKRLAALDLYKARHEDSPLDSMNHRINTLEYYMFGYEDDNKRFIFSPLGNLFLQHIDDEEKLKRIFLAMLFGIQFQHPANNTPSEFQLYPFRLIFKLLTDSRLDYRLNNTEYALLLPFIETIDAYSYEILVNKIISYRENKTEEQIINELKEDEHTYVNCVYEWQYYTQKLLKTAGIINTYEGDIITKLFHPSKPNSKSKPTGRSVRNGYVELSNDLFDFTQRLLEKYSPFASPVRLDDSERLMTDAIAEIYSFYPDILLNEIGEELDDIQARLLELPELINKYSKNPDNETAYLFEDALEEGFNMFINVDARKIGGAGHTDIECLYITKQKKFAVEAKSTANKLSGINSGRLRQHRVEIGGEYTIVITPNYVPATLRDIGGTDIVIIRANTFSQYLYNHIYHDIREIDYKDFDEIITNNLGTDISTKIQNMTMEKFATKKVG